MSTSTTATTSTPTAPPPLPEPDLEHLDYDRPVDFLHIFKDISGSFTARVPGEWRRQILGDCDGDGDVKMEVQVQVNDVVEGLGDLGLPAGVAEAAVSEKPLSNVTRSELTDHMIDQLCMRAQQRRVGHEMYADLHTFDVEVNKVMSNRANAVCPETGEPMYAGRTKYNVKWDADSQQRIFVARGVLGENEPETMEVVMVPLPGAPGMQYPVMRNRKSKRTVAEFVMPAPEMEQMMSRRLDSRDLRADMRERLAQLPPIDERTGTDLRKVAAYVGMVAAEMPVLTLEGYDRHLYPSNPNPNPQQHKQQQQDKKRPDDLTLSKQNKTRPARHHLLIFTDDGDTASKTKASSRDLLRAVLPSAPHTLGLVHTIRVGVEGSGALYDASNWKRSVRRCDQAPFVIDEFLDMVERDLPKLKLRVLNNKDKLRGLLLMAPEGYEAYVPPDTHAAMWCQPSAKVGEEFTNVRTGSQFEHASVSALHEMKRAKPGMMVVGDAAGAQAVSSSSSAPSFSFTKAAMVQVSAAETKAAAQQVGRQLTMNVQTDAVTLNIQQQESKGVTVQRTSQSGFAADAQNQGGKAFHGGGNFSERLRLIGPVFADGQSWSLASNLSNQVGSKPVFGRPVADLSLLRPLVPSLLRVAAPVATATFAMPLPSPVSAQQFQQPPQQSQPQIQLQHSQQPQPQAQPQAQSQPQQQQQPMVLLTPGGVTCRQKPCKAVQFLGASFCHVCGQSQSKDGDNKQQQQAAQPDSLFPYPVLQQLQQPVVRVQLPAPSAPTAMTDVSDWELIAGAS